VQNEIKKKNKQNESNVSIYVAFSSHTLSISRVAERHEIKHTKFAA
jgi:hypothetical protein